MWARNVGIAACIVDGGVRDISSMRALDHAVWCAGRTPITGRHRVEAVEINGAVSVGGVQVRPGDLIVADDTGVCVVPQGSAREVLERCLASERAESRVLSMLSEGQEVADILAVLPAHEW
jgi:regulator of RNase E activity RraA